MTIDWGALVGAALQETIEINQIEARSHPTSGNGKGEVGTEQAPQHIEKKEIKESDSHFPTVPTTFEEAKDRNSKNNNSTSYTEPAGVGLEEHSAPWMKPVERACSTCAHFYRPGLSDGHCGGREDLPFAYTPGHPLRKLPPDLGADCSFWELHPFNVARGSFPAIPHTARDDPELTPVFSPKIQLTRLTQTTVLNEEFIIFSSLIDSPRGKAALKVWERWE